MLISGRSSTEKGLMAATVFLGDPVYWSVGLRQLHVPQKDWSVVRLLWQERACLVHWGINWYVPDISLFGDGQ